MSEPKNTDPFAPWNSPEYQDDPTVPHNDPVREDDPFEPWNDIFGDEDDLSDKDARAYGLRRQDYHEDDLGEEEW